MSEPLELLESRKQQPLAVRFWRRVDKTTGCWLWRGTTRNGYGSLKVRGRPVYAHRLLWVMAHGGQPDALCILHRCDTPRCVNPAHLFLGDRKDNAIDCASKGRNVAQKRPEVRRGEQGSRARLTESQVASIRARYAAGGVTHAELGAEYGVEKSTIGKIVTRKLWGHVA